MRLTTFTSGAVGTALILSCTLVLSSAETPTLDWVSTEFMGVARTGTNLAFFSYMSDGDVGLSWMSGGGGTNVPGVTIPRNGLGPEPISTFDDQGNLLTTGAGAGPTTLAPFDWTKRYLAKFGSDGRLRWNRVFASDYPIYGRSLAVDHQGNAYMVIVASTSLGPVAPFASTIGDEQPTDYCGNLIKVDENGVVNQIKLMGFDGELEDREGYAYLVGSTVNSDSNGRIWVTGGVFGATEFDGIKLRLIRSDGQPLSGGLAVCYDTNQVAVWAQPLTPTSSLTFDWAEFVGGAIDPEGNLFACGYYRGFLDNGHALVAKYSKTGELAWVTPGGGTHRDLAQAVTADSTGGCWVTGEFQGTASFSGKILKSAGPQDLFLVHYGVNGDVISINQLGDPSRAFIGGWSDFGQGVCLDTLGHVYVAGHFVDGPIMSDLDVVLNWTNSFTNTFVARWTYDSGLAASLIPPRLTVAVRGSNLILSWPKDTGPSTLETISCLEGSCLWQTVSETPVTDGQLLTVQEPLSSSRQFYRLRRP